MSDTIGYDELTQFRRYIFLDNFSMSHYSRTGGAVD
jgi:hypothetical protein